jgi:hypothetical protein
LPVPLLAAQPVDGVVAGKPLSGSIVADQPFQLTRFFSGAGAPSSSTLFAATAAGEMTCNGKYLVNDLYFDTAASALYRCTTAGTNAVGSTGGSAWVQISGGGGSTTASFTFWTQALAYTFQPGATVQVQSQLVIGGITIVPGTYGCMVTTVISGAVSATNNMFPQFPYPTAPDMNGVTVYWMLIALGVTPVNVCSAGNKTIYLNASSPF